MGSDDRYVKREWDSESGSWVPTSVHVPDPGVTVPGQYVSDELYRRISTGSYTKEDVKAFQDARKFDFPDWASASMIPEGRLSDPALTPRRAEPKALTAGLKKKKKKDTFSTQAMLMGSIGGLIAGVVVAMAAILFVAAALALLT